MGWACLSTRSLYLALVRILCTALYHLEKKEQSFRFCLKRHSGIFLGLNVLCEYRVPCSFSVCVDKWLEEEAVVAVFAVVGTVSRACIGPS